jgi:hypothetical protein
MLIHLWKVSKCVFTKAATFLWKIVKCGQQQKQLNMVAHKEETEEKQMAKEMDQYEDGMIRGKKPKEIRSDPIKTSYFLARQFVCPMMSGLMC